MEEATADEHLQAEGSVSEVVHRLRDFWASPSHGSQGRARWQQTMGSMVLRLMLQGGAWSGGLSEEEFQVRICERGIRVSNRHRPEADEAFLKCSLNGDFPDDLEVLVRSSWWSLDCCESRTGLHFARESILVVHLAKAKDRSWPHPFAEQKLAVPSDLSTDWVTLPAGKPAESASEVKGLRAEDLLEHVGISQTDELVTVRLLLKEDKLEDAKKQAPLSRLFGLDLTEDSLRIFFRCDGNTPLLVGQLCGKIVPVQTDWSMTKVTMEEGDIQHRRQTSPALVVQLRKAACSRSLWPAVLVEHSQEGPREIAPDCTLSVEDQAPSDDLTHADADLKAKGDECFRTQKYDMAVDFYSKALQNTPDNEKLLSNRSAALEAAGRFQEALDDAVRCEELAPKWPKSLYRQGLALKGLKRYDMAISAFSEGQARELENPNWQKELEDTERLKAARQASRSSRK
ncbi:unnamed protein product [Polarella glacialis]|uniref:CS domain-containing protein n=1 Tax=Polarella glacialis TaxID=89957 RepID=A0A813EW50_POLGL|nr:unnamed protein product [Polarella glacialis]CAE8654792.1 unnamed protein product [Polarella glacialis]